jgi:hypothetical protein
MIVVLDASAAVEVVLQRPDAPALTATLLTATSGVSCWSWPVMGVIQSVCGSCVRTGSSTERRTGRCR